MTTKTARFWIRKTYLYAIKEAQSNHQGFHFDNFVIQNNKASESDMEITISWKEPRKVTISEEDFDKKYTDVFISTGSASYHKLKKLLFGDE